MNNTFKPFLLPYFFKKIGIIYLILLGLFIICKIAFSIPVWEYVSIDKETLKTLSQNILLSFGCLIAMSKEKTESEITASIRIKSIIDAFGYSCFLFIIHFFVHTLFSGIQAKDTGAQDAFFMLLFIYIGVFHWELRKAKKSAKTQKTVA